MSLALYIYSYFYILLILPFLYLVSDPILMRLILYISINQFVLQCFDAVGLAICIAGNNRPRSVSGVTLNVTQFPDD